MYDLNNRDENLSHIKISDIPRESFHMGSFSYIASIITAIGRTQILSIINSIPIAQSIFYADTDSIILNEEAYMHIVNNFKGLIDNSKLGCLKNEYPG